MRILARIFILFALAFSVYLAQVSLTSGAIAGCGEGTACDKILKSDWAYLGPLPVSIPAILIYGLLLLLLFGRHSWDIGGQTLRVALSVSIVFTILWFVGIQVFVLGEICRFCMASHLFGFAGAVLVGLEVLGQGRAGKKSRSLAQGLFLGALATAGFILLQFALPKPARSVEYVVDAGRIDVEPPVSDPVVSPQTEKPVSQAGSPVEEPAKEHDAENTLPEEIEAVPEETAQTIPPEVSPLPDASAEEDSAPEQREEPVPVYSIHGGEFKFPVNEIPGIGDWRVPNIMLNLIDFACNHCREHYRIVRERAPFYTDEIFFGILPLALNERCNPYFSMPGLPDYANCEYARLALAVWHVAPQHYLELVDWLCKESSPPASLDKANWAIAREFAEDLIGSDLLEKGWNDPWVDDMMRTLTELYGYNLKVTGDGNIPQQFLNQKLRIGAFSSTTAFDISMGLDFPIEIKRRR